MSTKEVFGLPNSDLVPGVYEGVHQSSTFTLFRINVFAYIVFLDRDESTLSMLANDLIRTW